MSTEVNAQAADTTNASAETLTANKLYGGKAEDVQQGQVDAAAEAKTVDAKAAEDTKQVEAKTEASGDKKDESKDAIPEKYSFEVPDGDDVISDDDLSRIAQYAKERGLKNDEAQKLVDMQVEAVAKFKDAQSEVIKSKTTAWKEESMNDKEFGGSEFNRNVELAKRAIDQFADPKLKQTLEETGLGNHPELLRVFVRIGKAMGESRLVMPGAQNAKPKSHEEIFYGSN